MVDCEAVRGSDDSKRRPAIVVTADRANAGAAAGGGHGVVTVVPVTSNTARVLPFQVLLPAQVAGLQGEGKAQAEQVRSVSVERLGPPLGRLSPALMAAVDDALRLHLAL